MDVARESALTVGTLEVYPTPTEGDLPEDQTAVFSVSASFDDADISDEELSGYATLIGVELRKAFRLHTVKLASRSEVGNLRVFNGTIFGRIIFELSSDDVASFRESFGKSVSSQGLNAIMGFATRRKEWIDVVVGLSTTVQFDEVAGWKKSQYYEVVDSAGKNSVTNVSVGAVQDAGEYWTVNVEIYPLPE